MVMIVGVGALVYGVVSLQKQIVSPFKIELPDSVMADLIPQSEAERVASLKQKDTDEDTLSDYDESYIYDTSPYIADTDSDGVPDAEEIKLGTDPTCPMGERCQGVRIIGPDTKISDLFPEFSDSVLTLKDRTIIEFKSILLDQGYDAEKLAEMDDDVLLIILEEALKLQDQEVSEDPDQPGETVDLNEVRELLIEMGVPEDEVYSLSDSDVEEILRSF